MSIEERMNRLAEQMKALLEEDPEVKTVLGFVRYKDKFFTLSFPNGENESNLSVLLTTSLRFELALKEMREQLHEMNLRERHNIKTQAVDTLQALNRLAAVISEARQVATEEEVNKLIVKCRDIVNEQTSNTSSPTE